MVKMTRKSKRRLVAVLFFFFFLFFLLFLFFHKKNYEIHYQLNDYEIKESFDKEKDYYYFEISKEAFKVNVALKNQSFFSKKLIYHLDTFEEDKETCLKIYSNKLRFYPLCTKDNEQVSYHLVSDAMKKHLEYNTKEERKDTYENINIINYDYQEYYIWNYEGFYRLRNDYKEKINLFTRDIYEPKLLYQVRDLLFIPNYDNNYYFTSAYILNMNTGKYEEWNFKEKIYFESTILGTYEDEFYLVDKHEKKEWKVNLKKKKLTLIAESNEKGLTYQNGFQKIAVSKLVLQDYYFNGLDVYDYEMNNGLYRINKLGKEKILTESPKEIITSKDDTVYYLKDNTLYAYNPFYGEYPLMSYFEWNFNYKNVIFIKK